MIFTLESQFYINLPCLIFKHPFSTESFNRFLIVKVLPNIAKVRCQLYCTRLPYPQYHAGSLMKYPPPPFIYKRSDTILETDRYLTFTALYTINPSLGIV